MATSHSSTSAPHPGGGGAGGVAGGGGGGHALFRKDRERGLTSRLYKPAPPLPDVCPTEPTGDCGRLCDGPSVVADQHRWTVYNSKVNLPAALNDPRLAKRESDFFTKTWGLDFAETEVMPSHYLPNITREHFTSYLQDTAQREKIHERCKTICPVKDELDSASSITNNHDKWRTELEQVPKIFMKPDFALDDPATFNAVLPWSHFSIAGGKGSRDAASSRLLQEKLSHYLDVVEVSIARQISLRSEAFFHAMSSQHDLQDRLRATARAVAALRQRTDAMQRAMCQGPLSALQGALTRANCLKLHSKLKLMAAVHQTQPTVQLLLSTSEFVGALELIGTTQEVLQQELQGVLSFRHLGSQLCEMERLIDKMMVADFSTYARSDLSRTLEEEGVVLEKDRLESLVFGLLRQRKLDFLEIYSEEVILAAKGIVKQCVMNTLSQLDEVDTDTALKLADQMRLMTFVQWFDLLQTVFSSFLLFLKRIKATLNVIRTVVLEVLDSSQRARAAELTAPECRTGAPHPQAPPPPPPCDADVAYLTHEGLFISDAFAQPERTAPGPDSAPGPAHSTNPTPGHTPDINPTPSPAPCPSTTPGPAPGPNLVPFSNSASGQNSASSPALSRDPCGSDSASGTTDSSSTPAGGAGIALGGDMMPSDLELGRVAGNIQELLYAASDVSHDRCAKFLMARAKVHRAQASVPGSRDGALERLSSAEFVCLSQGVEQFVRDTEQLCHRRSVSLQGALQSQANRFVQRFHEERKTKLSLLLDNERWKQAEVPAEFQDLVNSIADGRISLPDRKNTGATDRKPSDYLKVDGQKYAVVGTVLLLIRIFLEYCQCVNDIPSIATDLLTRLSDLLKHFNSRSCQLVLGAGALQVVGLKTITTKNLALASRCLQLVVHYIPIIRAHFETKLQPKQYSVLRHFDHITKDYNDHIAEISAKLVAIMDSLFEKVLSKYEVKAPMPSACFRNVCKQMAKMHEAIYDLLPEEQTQMLFLRICTSFKLHLKRQLARLSVVNDGGPQHGLVMVDVAFYVGNIQGLRSLENLDLNMAEIWEAKR